MANINNLKLKQYINKYKLTTFIETGTHAGDGVEFARKNNLQVYSCDISKKYIDYCAIKFKDDSLVNLYIADSLVFLRELLPIQKEKSLFWLDSHFISLYDKTIKETIENRFPVFEEVKLIKALKLNYEKDVIVIDDIRVIFGNDNPRFWFGNKTDSGMEEKYVVKDFSLTDLISIFSDTHETKVSSEYEGYLIFYPKNND